MRHMTKLAFLTATVAALSTSIPLIAQTSDANVAGNVNAAKSPAASEQDLIAALHDAAKYHDTATIDGALGAAPDVRLGVGRSVAMARRSATACAWLCNQNQYGDAMVLARRTIADLAELREGSPADRAERLFWEAWLNAEVLGDRTTALALLKTARNAAPQDKHLEEYTERIAKILETFGR